MLSACFTPKPVLYRHPLIVWWLKKSSQFEFAKCTLWPKLPEMLNQLKCCHAHAICNNSTWVWFRNKCIEHLTSPCAVLVS